LGKDFLDILEKVFFFILDGFFLNPVTSFLSADFAENCRECPQWQKKNSIFLFSVK
jgi:hypothetical protein